MVAQANFIVCLGASCCGPGPEPTKGEGQDPDHQDYRGISFPIADRYNDPRNLWWLVGQEGMPKSIPSYNNNFKRLYVWLL